MDILLWPLVCALFLAAVPLQCQKLLRPCLDKEKLCFGLPPNCISQGQECDILARIVPMADPEEGVEVELFGKLVEPTDQSGWFALGISIDKEMGDDLFTFCRVFENGTINVGEGYNVGTKPEQINSGLATSRTIASRDDLMFKCSWVQRGRVTYKGKTFDIVRNSYHLELARGPLRDSGWIGYHGSEKVVSSTPVKLQSIGTLEAALSVSYLIKLHGSLMLIAWLGYVSISIMVARHYKDSWSNRKICGVNIWFALHRALMVCALLFVVLGMTSIYIHVGGWRANNPHQYLGVFANILMFIQPIGALFRRHPEHPKRFIFNWFHWFCGNTAHISAISAIFFSATLQSIKLNPLFLWVMVAYAITHVMVHLVMQTHSIFSRRKDIDDLAMKDYRNGELNQISPEKYGRDPFSRSGDSFKQTMLGFYVVLIVALTTALLIIVIASGKVTSTRS